MLFFSCGSTGEELFVDTDGTFTDSRDDKVYKYAKIGTQTWMAENLNYNAEDSKCYDNQKNNCDIYGRLYNWVTAMELPFSCNSSICSSYILVKHKGVCPTGWHIPTNAEWDKLHRYAGGINGTEAYGFAALLGGVGVSDGNFYGIDEKGSWWNASEYNAEGAYGQTTYDYGRYSNYKSHLFSVRCLQDL